MALGNVNEAPVRLNALLIENVRLSWPVLLDRIMLHYRQEAVGQLYRVLGSADFIGNPVGLFKNVTSGVTDLWYEPFNGIALYGDRDIPFGVARVRLSSLIILVFLADSGTRAPATLFARASSASPTAWPRSRVVSAKAFRRHRSTPNGKRSEERTCDATSRNMPSTVSALALSNL